MHHSFSEGKNVAAYLKFNQYEKDFLVINYQCSGPAICGYLDRKVYYPETNKEGSFCLWNTNPFTIDKSELIKRLEKISSDEMILILNDSTLAVPDSPETVFSNDNIEINYMTCFNKGIVKGENYFIYNVKKNHNLSSSD